MDRRGCVGRMMAAGFAMIFAAGLLAGCSTPQERAAEAQERVANERMALVKKYQECAKQAGADASKRAECDSYLKSAEALK